MFKYIWIFICVNVLMIVRVSLNQVCVNHSLGLVHLLCFLLFLKWNFLFLVFLFVCFCNFILSSGPLCCVYFVFCCFFICANFLLLCSPVALSRMSLLVLFVCLFLLVCAQYFFLLFFELYFCLFVCLFPNIHLSHCVEWFFRCASIS